MPRRSGISIKTTAYARFRGADFSTDPALVDRTRSPLCTNMISDGGGMPEKRLGWRTLHTITTNDTSERVNGLHVAKYGGTEYLYAHAGTKIFTWRETGTPTVRLTGVNNARSRGASLGGAYWMVTGGEYVKCIGNTVSRVTDDNAYIPTTVITREPTGGGVEYEAVNLLSRWRKNAFQTDGTATEFQLDATNLDATGTVRCWIWGEEVTSGFTVNRTSGKVTFTTAPAAPGAGNADGLVVQFPKTVSGYADMINRCTIITAWGAGSADRIVVSGNPDYPNRDWISGYNDPTYFPDLGYSTVGIEATAIRGYCRIGNALAIVKEDNGQDSTVFFRTADVSESGEVTFRLQQAITGVGAVSAGGFATLLDEPLFVSGTGIIAVTTNYLNGDRVGQNRSWYINSQLTAEPLADCEAVSWNGLYLLSIGNGHVYALDGRQQKTYRSESLGDFVYEGYYWENVPARCWLNVERGGIETLYFGTADGRICRFNDDVEKVSKFSDDGAPIRAVWATKMDDDGDPTLLKTLIKRGCAVTLKPYTRSSAQICFRTDADAVDYVAAEGTMDIFDWEDIDFARFAFNSNDAPEEIFFNTKVKKYKRLQILIRNEVAGEGFGVFGITKHYVVGNFAKR